MRTPARLCGNLPLLGLLALGGCSFPIDPGAFGEGGGGGTSAGDGADADISVNVSVGITVGVAASSASTGCCDCEGSCSQGAGGETSGGGEGGAVGAGGSGGGTAVPSACPGEPHTLDVGSSVTISGTTDGVPNLLDSCWEGEDGGELAYELTLAQGGTLHLEIVEAVEHNGPELDAALVLLETCGDLGSQYCFDSQAHGEATSLGVEPGTLTLIVEAMRGTSGAFDLVATLEAAVCGDGVLNPGETCDVGPAVPNDGCGDPGTTMACRVQATTSTFDVCPGEPVAVGPGTTMLALADGYSTLGFSDDYIGTCFPEVGGPERVFAVTPSVSGVLTVKVGFEVDGVTSWCASDATNAACFDVEIYARSECDSPAPEDELACASTCCDGETISFPVTAGQPSYVFIDGYDAFSYSVGPFNLHLELQ